MSARWLFLQINIVLQFFFKKNQQAVSHVHVAEKTHKMNHETEKKGDFCVQDVEEDS